MEGTVPAWTASLLTALIGVEGREMREGDRAGGGRDGDPRNSRRFLSIVV